MNKESLRAVASTSKQAGTILASIEEPMFATQPSSLGFPGDKTQSAYYLGDHKLSPDEISHVSQCLEANSILPENTRIQKILEDDKVVYQVHQASIEKETGSQHTFEMPNLKGTIRLVRGDHCNELSAIHDSLEEAVKYAKNLRQQQFIREYQKSFRSGNLESYKASQIIWIKDTNPSVENIFGFVEPYRDPYGIRAEFEGLVAISDRKETELLSQLVENSSRFIRRLPWADGATENDGKGPFEKALSEPPDFTSIHALAYCSSIIFPGINLPNYNDIRQQHGFKNVIIANRMSAESDETQLSPFVYPSEASIFQKHKYPAYYIWVVLHELLGHGTGKLMAEEDGQCNFNTSSPPLSPLDKKSITSWYQSGQTWTGVFGDLATTVDECRAELVGAYLMDDLELLSLFGYTSESDITAQDLTYNMYVQLGTDGLRGLQDYNVEGGKWGQAHSRAHFAMLKCLLVDGNSFMTVNCDSSKDQITIHVDRSRIISDGKPALGRMLLRLHMYRCTADVKSCRAYYEDLSKVEGEYLEWRRIVLAKQQPKLVFVQANTFLNDGVVTVKEYEPTPEGVIQSWAERNL